jgi:hypothetical protein
MAQERTLTRTAATSLYQSKMRNWGQSENSGTEYFRPPVHGVSLWIKCRRRRMGTVHVQYLYKVFGSRDQPTPAGARKSIRMRT